MKAPADPDGGGGEIVHAKPDKAEKAEKVDYATPAKADRDRAGFFTVYKKGQGYWTRVGTAAGAALLILLTAYQIYVYLPTWISSDRGRDIAIGVAAAFVVGLGLLAWRLMNKPSNADFLIATDSEMKKVNWTSRRELIGSTRIVIVFMFMIALFLFVIDLVFWTLFYVINVLKVPPPIFPK